MKYKSGDKVVVEIEQTSKNVDGENVIHICGKWVLKSQLLGKLEDFQPAEKKIKMTVEEKEEFDKVIKDNRQDIGFFFMSVMEYPDLYPNLHKRLFSENTTKDKQAQIEFVKALEKPSRIEVVKEKKYKIKILNGYLYNILRNSYRIADRINYGDNFTQSEIDKLQKQEQFKAIDLNKCKEEVEDE